MNFATTLLAYLTLGFAALFFCLLYGRERDLWDYVPDGTIIRNKARVLRYVHKNKIAGKVTLESLDTHEERRPTE